MKAGLSLRRTPEVNDPPWNILEPPVCVGPLCSARAATRFVVRMAAAALRHVRSPTRFHFPQALRC